MKKISLHQIKKYRARSLSPSSIKQIKSGGGGGGGRDSSVLHGSELSKSTCNMMKHSDNKSGT